MSRDEVRGFRRDASIPAAAQVHAQHRRRAPALGRGVAAATRAIGRPALVLVITVLIVTWIVLNLLFVAAGLRPPDPPPFQYLSGAVSIAALYLAAIILITQTHEDELATQRDQLMLELAILNEQKSAKIIRLLEEMRRNDPVQGDHEDAEADAMAVPADAHAVLEKIQSHSESGSDASRR